MKKVLAVLFAVLLIAVSAVPAFAAESPTGTYAYDVVFVPTTAGTGTSEVTRSIDEEGREHVLLKPVPAEGYEFDYWIIEGQYGTAGKLTDAELELVVTGDVTVTPVFKVIGTPSTYVEPGSTDAATEPGSTDAATATDAAGTTSTSTKGASTTIAADTTATSPKTGSSDMAVYSVIFLAVTVCGAATLKLVKSK